VFAAFAICGSIKKFIQTQPNQMWFLRFSVWIGSVYDFTFRLVWIRSPLFQSLFSCLLFYIVYAHVKNTHKISQKKYTQKSIDNKFFTFKVQTWFSMQKKKFKHDFSKSLNFEFVLLFENFLNLLFLQEMNNFIVVNSLPRLELINIWTHMSIFFSSNENRCACLLLHLIIFF
jgi:hypothetical protein